MSETRNVPRCCHSVFKSGRAFAGRMLLCLIIAGMGYSPAKSYARLTQKNVIKEKYAAYIVDAHSGKVLHSENENKRLHPASLTKLMTLLMVFDALDRGSLRLHNSIYISRHAASMSPSKLNLPAGSTIKVEDAILALVTKSANDVAVALAEKLGGTESEFSYMMTRKARQIGMRNTLFKNASGLHHKKQISTARDMSILARVLINDYRDYYHYFSTQSFSYNGTTYRNHNKLMKTYDGMDGMKTGYIQASGFNLIASAIRNDHRLIGVVFGGRTGRSRNAQMEALLDNAFDEIGGVYILASEVPVPERKPRQADPQDINIASLNVRNIATPSVSFSPDTPVPAKKPDTNLDVASAGAALLPQDYAAADNTFSRWNMLDSSRKDSMFNRMIGEGDYDVTVRNRIETGIIAISAQLRNARNEKKNREAHAAVLPVQTIPASTPPAVIKSFAETGGVVLSGKDISTIEPSAASSFEVASLQDNSEKPQSAATASSGTDLHGRWSIQVGAFASRKRTEDALAKTLDMLPSSLSGARSRVAPLKTAQGWIYRARFDGYSKAAAKDACSLLPDCIALAPVRK